MTESWWLNLDRTQFDAAIERETHRMQTDPKAKHYHISFYETKEPRRIKPTPYVYHLEDERLSA